MKPFVLPFSQLNKKSVAIAGGKGANLGELLSKKIPVPPGFVVVSAAFDRFVEETDCIVEIDKWLHQVNLKNIASIDRASHEIRSVINSTPFPKDIGDEILQAFTKLKAPRVAVRSSATAEDSAVASWAGELETYLFVTKANVLDKVKECWSSLFTPRAIFYRFEKNLHKQRVSVAVVIQQMVESEISGITFTAHPVSRDRDQMVIEAGWGQGESIVSGSVTPDTYVYDRITDSILDINVSDQKKMIVRKGASGIKTISVPKAKQGKQKLTGKQIVEVAEMSAVIEKHYKVPQDIEWAIAKNKLYITQTRPITTLG